MTEDQKATVRLSAEALARVLADGAALPADLPGERSEFLEIVEPPPAPRAGEDVDLADDPDYQPA